MIKMDKPGAFTLVELILVVVVVITLALIGVPSYVKSKNRAIGREGISNIKLMAAAERIYRMENGAYAACGSTAACNSTLKLMLNGKNWSYFAGSTGQVLATSTAASGISCTYSLLPSGYDGEPTGSYSCP
jgi:type II secretory pathway pseudopilin PulG